MATTKSMKIQAEIDKVKAKISEQQARLKELEQKKLEAENSEIVDIVRGAWRMFSSAMVTAVIPDEQLTAPMPCSIAATLFSKASTVGLLILV